MSASVCTFICSHVDVYIIVFFCVQYIALLVGGASVCSFICVVCLYKVLYPHVCMVGYFQGSGQVRCWNNSYEQGRDHD